MTSEFNVNSYVSVRLTDAGKDILRQRRSDMLAAYPSLRLPDPIKTDDDGWQRFQLWDLMNEFGKHCSLGSKIPFETTIRIHHETPAA